MSTQAKYADIEPTSLQAGANEKHAHGGYDEKHVHDAEHDGVVGHKVLEVEEARAAIAKEHNLTLRQGLKAYPKAIMWSLLLSSAVIMEGYDTILVSAWTVGKVQAEIDDGRLGRTWGSHRSMRPLATKSSTAPLPLLPRGRLPSPTARISERFWGFRPQDGSSGNTATRRS